MSSFMDQIIAPYLTSPLANSTKIYNNVYSNGPDISLTNYYRSTSTRRSIVLPAAKTVTFPINPVNIETENSSEIETTTENISTNTSTTSADNNSSNNNNNKSLSPKKSMRKSIGGKKPYVARKLITAKKTTEPIKVVALNCKNQGLTVEKILKQINMTKYQQAFKKIDVLKFKDLKEIDLNAIGITRASEIKTFMDAIKKVQLDEFILKK